MEKVVRSQRFMKEISNLMAHFSTSVYSTLHIYTFSMLRIKTNRTLWEQGVVHHVELEQNKVLKLFQGLFSRMPDLVFSQTKTQNHRIHKKEPATNYSPPSLICASTTRTFFCFTSPMIFTLSFPGYLHTFLEQEQL